MSFHIHTPAPYGYAAVQDVQVRYQDPWGGGIQECSPQRTCTRRTGPPFDSSDSSDLQFILLPCEIAEQNLQESFV